jgi:uncharacterized protein (DUF885 family)
MRKIVNITVFAIAGIACILALVFSSGFDDKSKEKYFATSHVKEASPEMLSDLADATVQTLPDFIKKYQDLIITKTTENSKIQLQKEILYTFIASLKDLDDDQAKFDVYKAEFPSFSSKLNAEDVTSKKYTDEFSKVKTLEDLPNYITNLENDYAFIKQDYLVSSNQIKAMGFILKDVSTIDAIVSKNKKEIDLKSFQIAIKDYQKQETVLNFAMTASYIVFFITIGLLLVFSIYQIVKNFKSSMGAIFGVLILVVVAIIGYFVSPDQLTDTAIKMQTTPNEMKWIGAGLIVFYFVFFGTILAIIGSLVMNTVKKYR